MAYLRSKHTFKFSRDSTEAFQLAEKEQRADELTEAFASGSNAGPLSVGPGASVNVNLQGITPVKWLYIESDLTVIVSLNGVALPPLTPRTNAVVTTQDLPGRLQMWTDGITSISVANPAGSGPAAKVTVTFGGGA